MSRTRPPSALAAVLLVLGVLGLGTGSGCTPGLRESEDGPCSPGATRACYTGPAGTQGLGVCHGGLQTCQESGRFGACEGQRVPGTESCNTGEDEDCDGLVDNVPDVDGDGFTVCEGDCCETTGQCGEPTRVGPGALEVPTAEGGEPVDDDCDGMIDESERACAEGGAIDSTDPLVGAAAIGLCARESAQPAGRIVLEAKYVRGSGAVVAASRQWGVLDVFGRLSPRSGERMLGLSSGYARDANSPDACGLWSCLSSVNGNLPAGFPQTVPGCPGAFDANDDIGLQVKVRAPSNAVGFSVDHRFFTFEYPEYVCTMFNDQFIIKVDPAPEGSISGNIAFDSQTNPVSVNIGFFEVCEGCPAGANELLGTGFDEWNDAGGTVWLRSQAPIVGGQEATITFLIWDTGDANFDSTALIDNFQWILEGSPGVGTLPIP